MVGNIVIMNDMVAIPWTPMAIALKTFGGQWFDERERFWNTYTPEVLAKYSKKLGREVTVKNAMDLGLQPQTVFFFKDTPELRSLIGAYTMGNEAPQGSTKYTDIPNEAYAEMAAVLFKNRNQILSDIKSMPGKLKQMMPDGTWHTLGKDCAPHVLKHFGLK